MIRFSKTWLSLFLAFAGVAGGCFVVQNFLAPKPTLAEPLDWKPRQLAGLVFDGAGDFQTVPLNLGAAQEFVESSEMHVAKSAGGEIDVLRTVYKEGVELNFDGAVQGAVNGIARLDGIRNLQHTVTEATVSGKAARRLAISAERWRKSLRVEAVLMADGQSFYQVQVIFDPANPRAVADAERLLKSVRLGP